MIFAKRIYNEEYQTDPFPNMSSLFDKYSKYYRGSEQNKMQNFSDGFTRYKRKKETISYDDLSKEIDDIKKLLEKEIEDYSVAYKLVNKNNTLEPNDDPFTKKLQKAKELKEKLGEGVSKVGEGVSKGVSKVGEGVSKVGKFVSKGVSKVKERFKGKKPNPENDGVK